MSATESWTVGRLLTWTADYLKKSGGASPRLEAELLLAEARGCERIELYTAYEEIVTDDVRGKFRDLVRRRAEGTPVAYLLGRREFYSLSFVVTPDVLIPRPETEFAVIAILDWLKARPADAPPAEIVDVGTGSGAIAVTLAKQASTAHVTAIDISEAALAVAKMNAERHGVSDRITFLHGDLLESFPADPRFDAVVSNPPYVSEAEFAELSPEVRNHEPRSALVGGVMGTEIIARLIPQAAERMRSGGILAMEMSPMIDAAVRELLAADDRFTSVQVRKDLAGLARIATARRS